MKCRWWIPVLLLLGVFASADRVEGHVYNLHLVTDNVPDYTDMSSLAHSTADLWQTPQDKAIAVWRWGRRSRRQTSCADEDGQHDLGPDPALQLLRGDELRHHLLAEHRLLAATGLPRPLHPARRPYRERGLLGRGQDLAPLRFLDEHLLLQPQGRGGELRRDPASPRLRIVGRQERAGTFLLLSLHAAVRLALRPHRLAIRLRQPGREPTDALQRGRFLHAQLLRGPLLPVCAHRPPLHAGHQALRVVYPILGAAGPPASNRSRCPPAIPITSGPLRRASPSRTIPTVRWTSAATASGYSSPTWRPRTGESTSTTMRDWWRKRAAGPGSIRPRPGGRHGPSSKSPPPT